MNFSYFIQKDAPPRLLIQWPRTSHWIMGLAVTLQVTLVNTRWQHHNLAFRRLCPMPSHSLWSESQDAGAGRDNRSHLFQNFSKSVPWRPTSVQCYKVLLGGGRIFVVTLFGHMTSQKLWVPVGLGQWLVWGGVGGGVYSPASSLHSCCRLSASLRRPQLLVSRHTPYTYFHASCSGIWSGNCWVLLPFMSRGANSTHYC